MGTHRRRIAALKDATQYMAAVAQAPAKHVSTGPHRPGMTPFSLSQPLPIWAAHPMVMTDAAALIA